jgi:hypothetical protein
MGFGMSEGKNNESEPQKEQAEKKPNLNKEQYKLLLSCSEKKDVTNWNDYRKFNPDDEIWLQGANFWEFNVQGDGFVFGANLQDANLEGANLQGAVFSDANLRDADLREANLQDAELWGVNLQGVFLERANLQGADLRGANLQDAKLEKTNLQGADLGVANLQDADLGEANLQGTTLRNAKLQGADFTTAIVDGRTLIWECEVNRYSKSKRFTDFEGVGLDSVRIDPETKQLLEYNIRRKNWEEWYSKHLLLKWPVYWFWSISDYGLSTGRITNSFILLVIAFATIYFAWGWADYYLFGIKNEPGIVKNLFIAPQAQQQISDVYYFSMIYFRSVCFSVATMFSFGDISAVNTQFGWKWWFSHLIPIAQMVTGYMLLGALITRFAILFTAGGPAGKFTKSELKEKAR